VKPGFLESEKDLEFSEGTASEQTATNKLMICRIISENHKVLNLNEPGA
jgi:hypothetical protein